MDFDLILFFSSINSNLDFIFLRIFLKIFVGKLQSINDDSVLGQWLSYLHNFFFLEIFCDPRFSILCVFCQAV